MVRSATVAEIEELKSRHIQVLKKDGSIVYEGPLAKPLIYNGIVHEDYLLLAEPCIIDSKAYQLINIPSKQWRTGWIHLDGYRVYKVNKLPVCRGPALLWTFIGPPPEPDWTCNHLHVDETKTRIQIRSDDLLDRIVWADKSTQSKDRVTVQKNAKSYPVNATNVSTGETISFQGIQELARFLNSCHSPIREAIKKQKVYRGWTIVPEAIDIREGELWVEVSPIQRISSFGRVALITKLGYLVEWRSIGNNPYLKVKVNGKTYRLHHLVIIHFGSDEDRQLLKQGWDVDHKDGDPRNNHINNLQLLNKRDHAIKTSGKRMRVTEPSGNVIEFNSAIQAANHMGVTSAAITNYIYKGQKNKDGFVLQYID